MDLGGSLTRRRVLTLAPLLGVALTAGLNGCSLGAPTMVRADVARRPAEKGRAQDLVPSVTAFSMDLLRRLPSEANLICSPFSVMVAVAMVRNGATGETAAQMDDVLHFPALADLNAGMNAIDQALRTRTRRIKRDGADAEISLSLANSAWGQTGLTWQPPFLDALARSYGTGVFTQDFAASPTGARKAINGWVADETEDRITELIQPDVITSDTRLMLVNALHLKGPWLEPFVDLGSRAFRTPTGEKSTPTNGGLLERNSGIVGEGWTAARILVVGGELAMTVVLGDGDLATLLAKLDGKTLARILIAEPQGSVDLTMPAFGFRSEFSLGDTLTAMGMERAFSAGAELGGLTADEGLRLSHVVHQGWVAVDEDGVEAAAATAVGAMAVSAPAPPKVTLVLDRPFLFCLHDVETGVPLLIGLVNDPSPA